MYYLRISQNFMNKKSGISTPIKYEKNLKPTHNLKDTIAYSYALWTL